jgi:Eco57I restriction-modification methylase
VGLRSLVAKEIVPNFQDGAFAVFYSKEEQEWRFSFITKFQDWNLVTNELYDFETHPKRYTYLFGTPGETYRTALERFGNLATSLKTLDDILEAFSVEAFNDQFYKDYQNLSVKLVRAIYPTQVSGKMQAHQGVLNLLNRLLFVCFIQKKGWLMTNDSFVFDLWKDYKSASFGQNAFHEHWLNHVFFSAFNGKAYRNPDIFKSLPEKYHKAVIEFPYLNGGLFTKSSEYDSFTLNDQLFDEIFALLGSYNFTISEDTPEDINLEISPELLGKMYEGMINATDLDDVDAENGIVYTERPEINFMVRRSLVEILQSKLNSQFSKDFLYHFCFDKPEQKGELFKNYNARVDLLRNALTSITACDPACGSGSMLLGVIQVQMELLRSIDDYLGSPHTPKDDYLLKKQIISESIYGVDIKEWAVRIAELRFWLYMIEEAEFTPEELTKEPLLPNLDFKLRTGNSLLQKFGSMDFTLEALFKGRDKRSGATRKLNDFIRRKKDFIQNKLEEQASFEKLKEEECAIFKEFIDELIFEKRARLKHLQNAPAQGDLFSAKPTAGNLFQGEIDNLKEEIHALLKMRDFIKAEKRLPFSYDIDFMEVFLLPDDPGFDLIIGNPPYVRQEDILPPEDGEYLEHLMKPENKDEKQAENKKYKVALNARVYDTYLFLATTVKTEIDGKNKSVAVYEPKVPGRSDLFVYFQLLCPRYLNSKGTFCFIISNSWLDVDYGKLIQHFLLKHTRLIAFYDCNVRSFAAKVNTIIYLHSGIRQVPQRQQDIPHLKPLDNKVHFVMNKIPYEQAAFAPLLIEQEHCRENCFKDLYCLIVKSQQELYDAGYDEEEKKFTGDKWGGKYLKAPEIYYTILEKGKGKLVPLKEVADVRFGIKTGANEFFILSKEQAIKWGIEPEF